ncbi:MAG: DUF4157 domain-containing protein, partial [Bacteroidia bacterium]|nr:DUF4157 domain-containing protein [Bacteroidia bacterium]
MLQPLHRKPEYNSNMLIQPALEIGKEEDEHEQEANHVADKVMRLKDEDEKIQPMQDEEEDKVMCMTDEEEDSVMCMQDEEEEGVQIQKKTENPSSENIASQKVESGIKSNKGNGQSLPGNLQQEMGNKIGADFSDVKIHTGENSVQM